jgi:hypothetical protein
VLVSTPPAQRKKVFAPLFLKSGLLLLSEIPGSSPFFTTFYMPNTSATLRVVES